MFANISLFFRVPDLNEPDFGNLDDLFWLIAFSDVSFNDSSTLNLGE